MSTRDVPHEGRPVGLSVIIPSFNAETTLREQLDALAEQDVAEPWELIVADNGSTDKTVEIAEAYRGRIANLRVIDASDRRGASHARNVGVAAALGSRIAFCDADDVVAPNWLNAIARALDRHDLVASRFDGDRLNSRETLAVRKCPQQEGLMSFKYSRFLPTAGACGMGVRRKLFEALEGYDEQLLNGEDIDFCWRAQLGGTELHFVRDAVVHIRLRSEPGEIFRQTMNYGLWTVPLYRRYLEHGMPRVPWQSGVRSWLQLLLRLPRLTKRSTRTKWLKEFAYRWGLLKGSIRFRTLAL